MGTKVKRQYYDPEKDGCIRCMVLRVHRNAPAVFLGEYGTVMYMDSWKEAKEWLEGVVFDDPAVSDRVEKILHPEHFKEKKPSVLRKLEKKKKDLQTAKKKADPVRKREKNTQVL